MSDPISKLGLSCPKGGKFYICQGNTTEFIGCCGSDPCSNGSGKCPSKDLSTASFSADTYGNIAAQTCDDARGANVWYTCKATSPPFLGCCASNPCTSGSCPQDHLISAKLSSDAQARAAFVTSSSSSSPSASPTSSPNSSPSPTGSPQPSSGLSTGAIAGIAVGAGVVVIAIIGFLMYRCGWLARKRRDNRESMPMMVESPGIGSNPTSPYRQSYNTATSGTSPSFYKTSPMSAEFNHGSPQPSPDWHRQHFSGVSSVSTRLNEGEIGYGHDYQGRDLNIMRGPSEIDGREHTPAAELAAEYPTRHPHNLHPGPYYSPTR